MDYMLIENIDIQKNDPVIFDVGCFIDPHGTDFTQLALDRWQDAKIHGFDPINFKEYETKYENACGVILHKIALDDNDCKKEIVYIENLKGLTSMYEREFFSHPQLIKRKVNIHCNTLDNICEKYSIDHIDVLKIDTEGCEMRVLSGATKMLSNGCVDYIQVECGGCKDDAGYTELDLIGLLAKHNFTKTHAFEEDLLFKRGTNES
jgi:FkbM family methyltransferase